MQPVAQVAVTVAPAGTFLTASDFRRVLVLLGFFAVLKESVTLIVFSAGMTIGVTGVGVGVGHDGRRRRCGARARRCPAT